ncbi:MAG: DEAD/DEAH box helicase, partial [Crenarchaeota archaeon]|nr:DEAD/DEAH box helicase [Thermoproteota archaeon]
MIDVVYQRSCPSCGGDVRRHRLTMGLPCERCGTPRGLLRWKDELEEEYESFVRFLKKEFGIAPWGPQSAWAKMALSGLDAVISAPTGTGKSTFLAALSLYYSKKGKKVLYVVPSKSLEEQVRRRLSAVDVITMKKLMNSPEEYKGYDLYIFDDVDSAMKSVKSVKTVMIALGLEEAIPIVEEMVKLIKAGALDEDEGARKYSELKRKLEELKSKKGAQVLFASATSGEARLAAKLMLSVLGLSPARFPAIIRNIDDVKIKSDDVLEGVAKVASELAGKFKGIVFVHEGYPIEEVVEALRARGIRAEAVKSGRIKAIKKLEEGRLDVIVAYASRYGVAARGIDMPEVIRFAVFLRPPFKKYDLKKGLNKPFVLLKILKKLGFYEEAVRLAAALSKLSELELATLQSALEGEIEVEGRLAELLATIKSLKEKVVEAVDSKPIVDRGMVIKNGEIYIIDPKTYLQASGRTSRLTPDGMTHGVSVVVYDDEDLMRALEEELKDVTEFKEGLVLPGGKRPVRARSALMIVESPTKAKTFSKIMRGGGKMEVDGVPVYLGAYDKGDEVLFLYLVATKGHLFDLTLDDVGTYGIEIGPELRAYYAPVNRCPKCGTTWASSELKCPKCGARANSSIETVNALRKVATMVEEVLIATDPDEEGEKIGWDVYAMLYPFNGNIKRLKYYEVTLRGLREAFKNLGEIDEGLVMSQIVRRIDDRLVGFAISSSLKGALGDLNHGLGRVQGPVLNFIAERLVEWKRNAGYAVTLRLSNGDEIKIFVKDRDLALKLSSAKKVKVVEVKESVEALKPLPPYTTDALLEDAAKIGLGPSRAMRLAQDLFEMGFITYHRTDSTRVSDAGIA